MTILSFPDDPQIFFLARKLIARKKQLQQIGWCLIVSQGLNIGGKRMSKEILGGFKESG